MRPVRIGLLEELERASRLLESLSQDDLTEAQIRAVGRLRRTMKDRDAAQIKEAYIKLWSLPDAVADWDDRGQNYDDPDAPGIGVPRKPRPPSRPGQAARPLRDA